MESRQNGNPRGILFVKRVLIGNAVVVLLPGAGIFVWAWWTGQSANPAGGSTVPPTAFDALLYAYLYGLFVGLPAWIIWSIVCLVAALRKRDTPPSRSLPATRPDDVSDGGVSPDDSSFEADRPTQET